MVTIPIKNLLIFFKNQLEQCFAPLILRKVSIQKKNDGYREKKSHKYFFKIHQNRVPCYYIDRDVFLADIVNLADSWHFFLIF